MSIIFSINNMNIMREFRIASDPKMYFSLVEVE